MLHFEINSDTHTFTVYPAADGRFTVTAGYYDWGSEGAGWIKDVRVTVSLENVADHFTPDDHSKGDCQRFSDWLQKAAFKPSKGSLGFCKGYEYLRTPDGCLYRAPIHLPLDLDGYRQGARFECMPRRDNFVSYFKDLSITLVDAVEF